MNPRTLGVIVFFVGVIIILIGALGIQVSEQGMTVVDFPLVHLETETDEGAIRLSVIAVGAIIAFVGLGLGKLMR